MASVWINVSLPNPRGVFEHALLSQDISKRKVDTVRKMPRPHALSILKSFLGSVQLYGMFLPNLSTITELLRKLTRSAVK